MILIYLKYTSQFKGSDTEDHIKTFGAKGNIFSEGVKTLVYFLFNFKLTLMILIENIYFRIILFFLID